MTDTQIGVVAAVVIIALQYMFQVFFELIF